MPSPGGSSSAENGVTVIPYQPPAAQILYFGNVINGTQSVYVGQEIALTTQQIVLPGNLYVSGYLWNVPGTAVASFSASAAGGSVTGLPTLTYNPGVTFYWVSSGGSPFTVTYSYCVSNGQCSPQSSATFSVAAPTGAGVTVSTDTMHVWPNYLAPNLPGPVLLQFGNTQPNSTTQGITYSVSSTTSPPAQNQGTYSWVQLISKYVVTYMTNAGSQTCQPDGFLGNPPLVPPDPNPELDSKYPAYTGNAGEDSPPSPAEPWDPIGEADTTFAATTYLMWTPNPDSECTSGAACVIPVPLGSFNWGWSGDAINTMVSQSNGTNWILSCGSNTQGNNVTFQTSNPAEDPNYSYPVWQHRFDGSASCP
jgi:hypothetical protein